MRIKTLLFFLLPVFCFCQEKKISGKIETGALFANVLVVNLTNETETRTDGFGKFSIKAEAGDLLVFSGEFVRRKRFLVEEGHFGKENIIPLEVQDIEIEAVTIERFDINPEDLGLVPKGQKRYTPTEKRLFTALDEEHLGALINWITGKTRILKILVEMEREDQKVAYLSNLFENDIFTERLKIEPDNVMEFKYFAVHFIEKELGNSLPEKYLLDNNTSYLKSLSKGETELILITLAEKYLELKNESTTDEK